MSVYEVTHHVIYILCSLVTAISPRSRSSWPRLGSYSSLRDRTWPTWLRRGGRSAATRAAFGITSGVAVYVVAVAAGLGALVARHTSALIGMQLVGAVYLV
jgi:hypothetical protein